MACRGAVCCTFCRATLSVDCLHVVICWGSTDFVSMRLHTAGLLFVTGLARWRSANPTANSSPAPPRGRSPDREGLSRACGASLSALLEKLWRPWLSVSKLLQWLVIRHKCIFAYSTSQDCDVWMLNSAAAEPHCRMRNIALSPRPACRAVCAQRVLYGPPAYRQRVVAVNSRSDPLYVPQTRVPAHKKRVIRLTLF